MTDRELMRMALSTLEGWENHGTWMWPESALQTCKKNTEELIKALRERLAKPQSKWIPLTEKEIGKIYRDGWKNNMDFARAIEAKLKEKNTKEELEIVRIS